MFYLTIVNKILRHCHCWLARQYITHFPVICVLLCVFFSAATSEVEIALHLDKSDLQDLPICSYDHHTYVIMIVTNTLWELSKENGYQINLIQDNLYLYTYNCELR